MKKILFIHGAYHGGWCWDDIISYLPKEEFECHAIDLPGQAKNQIISKNKVKTNDYIEYVLNYIEINNLEDLYIISHSLGGITLSKIVEQIPSKIKSIFFLTSVILNGKSFTQILPTEVQIKYKQIASSRDDNSIPPNIERIKQILFNKSENSPNLDSFLSKLEPQPIGPYEDVIILESFQQTNVPITYIKCKYDVSLPKETFEEIISNLPSHAKILEIESDHEAMFSNPEIISNILLR